MRPIIIVAVFVVLSTTVLSAQDYTVAAYYFGNYHVDPRNEAAYGKEWTEWNLVRAAKPRFAGHQQPKVPLWGYEDESNPRVMEKKIAAAANHGITAFIFDWYWHDSGPFLERPLDQGFLKAKNRQRLEFAIMWANHDWVELFPAKPGVTPALLHPGQVTDETFDLATDHVIKQYFSQPNYWKVDGKPYVSIYELTTLVRGLGGVVQTKAALDRFRQRARAAGFPGIHLNAVDRGIQPEGIARSADELVKVLGIDSVTSYTWLHNTPLPTFPASDYPAWAQKAEKAWSVLQGRYSVPYFPNVSMGWDPSPRTEQSVEYREGNYPYTPIAVGNTPAELKEALEKVKMYLNSESVDHKIVMINAWNEWTEGSYLEPDRKYKMAYLNAIRAVFPPPQHSARAHHR